MFFQRSIVLRTRYRFCVDIRLARCDCRIMRRCTYSDADSNTYTYTYTYTYTDANSCLHIQHMGDSNELSAWHDREIPCQRLVLQRSECRYKRQ